jgi:hypothetical protein
MSHSRLRGLTMSPQEYSDFFFFSSLYISIALLTVQLR